MATNAMKIGKAFCRELGRTVDIQEAGICYFSQAQPRTKYSFYCSSPECDANYNKVEIVGVNYTRVPIDIEGRDAPELVDAGKEDDDPKVPPHFRAKSGHHHSEDCQWIIDQEAEREFINEAKSDEERQQRKRRVAKNGLIEESTFLFEDEGQYAEQKDCEKNSADSERRSRSEKTRRRHRVNEAKLQLAQPKKSPYFSDLVSSFMVVEENHLYSEPLRLKGIGNTTWGGFFKMIEWYDDDVRVKRAYRGNVGFFTLPKQFDWSSGELPNAVILTFYKEATVGKTKAKPSFKLTRKMVESNPGAYVLMEAVKSAVLENQYKRYLKCYFHGRILEEPKKGQEDYDDPELVLNVKPTRLNTIELRRIENDKHEESA